MEPVRFTFLNGSDIEQLELSDAEVLDAVEQGLRAQGRGKTVIEPRVHLMPDPAFNGHFNVLRGYVAPLGLAGVKIVGDYVDNYKSGLPSEMALLNLFDPRTGMPVAILDATAITEMRTGAVTALGHAIWRALTPRCSGTSGPAPPRTGTSACLTGSSTSPRYESIRAVPRAARPSPSAWSATSASPSS